MKQNLWVILNDYRKNYPKVEGEMNFKSFFRTLKFILEQPLNQENKLSATLRLVKWQIIGRVHNKETVYEWIEGSRFYFSPNQWGISGNIYTGLLSFEDMAFLLHTLKEEDMFVDVGANHGSYAILASAVVGAKTIAFEPIPETFNHLVANTKLNHIENKIKCVNKALGDAPGSVKFSNQRVSALNHVLTANENNTNSITVEVVTLDGALRNEHPTILKIDVEGYEFAVLEGSKNILKDPELKAIIIELNEFSNRYGYKESSILKLLSECGFQPVRYDPFIRKIKLADGKNAESKNTIFIRQMDLIEERIKNAPKFEILGKQI